ncbi:unnamed protein product [Lepeophtheirus salmonis]|uniref:(salmon louse) hypothetical protein n=1 Tax=Lepeophtheirus salmonis TaxID=72036 RepID=A0A7R8CCX7_LEPSM|nr:unnamed protein product [Lepeophtheirus salmonis]CAF2774088.1 unnamed protein product [Lepeophtheirus salmonis]
MLLPVCSSKVKKRSLSFFRSVVVILGLLLLSFLLYQVRSLYHRHLKFYRLIDYEHELRGLQLHLQRAEHQIDTVGKELGGWSSLLKFHLQEGLRYCTTCLTQSQQHGMETVVDEITMGSQPHEKKSTKMFSKKKRRKKNEDCYRSFTSLDGFFFACFSSVILRGWSEEAMLLGLTGPSFQPLLHQLFATYLKKTVNCVVLKPFVGHLHKRTTYIKKKGDFEKEDLDDTSSVSKRKRRKKRKAFFDSFLSGSSCKSDVNDDISFGESGTNSVITDSLETGSEFSSLASSVDDELLEDQNRIFEQRAYHLALPVLFALFSLALILQDDSRVCIADLLFFIECDSISFYDAFVHIPKFMRLQGNEDILRFSRHRAYRKLEPEGIKVIMYQMISLLELGNVNFGGPFYGFGLRSSKFYHRTLYSRIFASQSTEPDDKKRIQTYKPY